MCYRMSSMTAVNWWCVVRHVCSFCLIVIMFFIVITLNIFEDIVHPKRNIRMLFFDPHIDILSDFLLKDFSIAFVLRNAFFRFLS